MKKKTVKIIAFCFIVFAFLVGGYFLKQTMFQKKYHNEKPVRIVYELDDYITIKNKLPLSDAIGKKYDGSLVEEGTESFIEFSIVNEDDDLALFEIYLTRNHITPREIKENYIKLYLTDEYDQPVIGFDKNRLPVYSELPYLIDKPSSKLLYSDILDGHSTKKYRLRAWLSDSYSISSLPETFQFEVGVKNH